LYNVNILNIIIKPQFKEIKNMKSASGWINLGLSEISEIRNSSITMSFDKNDNLYVAYADGRKCKGYSNETR
jgi:hypothetical protein